jgi:hypothetical protein
MGVPRFCRNPACINATDRPVSGWLVRNGTYPTKAHGRVQRYRCTACGGGLSSQTESIHYYSKRRLDLKSIYSRVRAGSSLRDIGRELGCSRTAVAHAVLRLGRQAMAAHMALLAGFGAAHRVCFDGLVSALCSRDTPTQITALGDAATELVLAMTHCVSERGGTRTAKQIRRLRQRRAVWRPRRGALSESIALLVNELPRFTTACASLHIDTDEHPLYARLIGRDLAMRWFDSHHMLVHTQTPSVAPRTVANPLFLMNYLDRMIRHRLKEHTRESIALGRNATMQMHRMWLFAWDHNALQPHRVAGPDQRSRAERAGLPTKLISRLKRQFATTRIAVHRLPAPESMRRVWMAELDTPVVRWRVGQKHTGPHIPAFARRDLLLVHPHGP